MGELRRRETFRILPCSRSVSGGSNTTRIFVGVAWPYSNGPFHIGHLAGAYLPGDTFARFHRLRGNEVLMVSGSDMHGTPTLVTAEKEGTSPDVVANRNHAINRDAFRDLGFSFDLFTTTHTPIHERTVQDLFLTLLENGLLRRRTEENAYCPKHARFLPDRYLRGECPYCQFPDARGDECDNCGRVLESRLLLRPRCSLCGTAAEFRPSEHFYLELDKLSAKLERFLSDKSYWRPMVLNVAQNFLREGLHPTPITRDLDWGIPLPLEGYDSKRFYVWFDAVTGYLSASKEWALGTGDPDAWHRFWDRDEPVRQYYFIGKDNVFFHTIVWPGMLIGAGHFHLPYDVPANQWLKVQGSKISKSRPEDLESFVPSLLSRYAPDVIRFYAALLAPQNHDTEFDWDEFHQVSEEILSNQYGNLVQRVLVLARHRFEGRIPQPPVEWKGGEGERSFRKMLESIHREITTKYEAVELKEALDTALNAIREQNRRIQESRPWRAPEPERQKTIYEALWFLKAVSVWLAPVLPFSSAEIWRMLGYPGPPSVNDWERALEAPESGQRLGEIRPLFPRREAPSGANRTLNETPAIDGLPPLRIGAGRVVSVTNHPSADKLYVLEVELGEASPRKIVAGIRPYYLPDQLKGKLVLLLTNLEPRTIRSVTSEGMLLAADDGGRAIVVSPPDSTPPGTLISGAMAEAPTIPYAEFDKTPLLIGRVMEGGSATETDVEVGGRIVRVPHRWSAREPVVVRLSSPDARTGVLLAFGTDRPVTVSSDLPSGTRVR